MPVRLPPSLKIVSVFSGFLIILLTVDGVDREYPLKHYVSHGMSHLIIVATAIVVGAMLLWIIEEAIAGHIAPAIRTGLQALAHDVREEVGKFPKSWESITQVMASMVVHNPEARHLASEGKIVEAVQKVTTPEEEITILIKSKDPAHWRQAADLLEKSPSPKPALTLAYLFWQTGDIWKAIHLGELALATIGKEPEVSWKVQNSLAYYYTETSDPKYERLAREYIAAARIAEPKRPEPVDTEAFVKITYAKTREELMEGVAICEKARALGAPFESYAKHIARAMEKLRNMPDEPKSGSESA
jgi:hypothetical protein